MTQANSLMTFNDLRVANIIRLPQFKNAQGLPAHTMEDGSDWSPSDWMTAVSGEVGEVANIIKKMRRGDFGSPDTEEFMQAQYKLALELADVVTYLDLLAYQFRLDLAKCVEIKFNFVSNKVGADVFLTPDGIVRYVKPGGLKEAETGVQELAEKSKV